MPTLSGVFGNEGGTIACKLHRPNAAMQRDREPNTGLSSCYEALIIREEIWDAGCEEMWRGDDGTRPRHATFTLARPTFPFFLVIPRAFSGQALPFRRRVLSIVD